MEQNTEYDENICDEEVWTWLQIKQNNLFTKNAKITVIFNQAST